MSNFTDEQVEAAAAAVAKLRREQTGAPAWFKHDHARAALEAATPAPVVDEEFIDRLAATIAATDLLRKKTVWGELSERDRDNYRVTARSVLRLMRPAPVVDVEKLGGVITKALEEQGFQKVELVWDSWAYATRDELSLASENPKSVVKIAQAVADYLDTAEGVLELLDRRKLEASAADVEELTVCAWCPARSRGSAWHNDGRLHPSCGQIDHGQGWVPND